MIMPNLDVWFTARRRILGHAAVQKKKTMQHIKELFRYKKVVSSLLPSFYDVQGQAQSHTFFLIQLHYPGR